MGFKVDLYNEWVEYFSVLLMIVGFFISLILRQPLFSYFSVSILGFLMGRIFYIKKLSEPILPFTLMILAFFVGYLAGGFFVSRIVIFILFVATFIASYYLHLKKIFTIFKSKDFFK